MSIFTKIFGEKKELRQPFIKELESRFGNGSGSAQSGQYLKEFRNWVFACVDARAEDVGNIQLKLMKGDEEVTDHALLNLINKVNPFMTANDLFYGTQAFRDLDGNAFWYLARENDGKGEVKEIYLLRPDRMEFALSKTNPLQIEKYYYKVSSTEKIPFNPDEIIHFKNFNPFATLPYPHRGMGIVQASAMAIDTDNEARTWNFNFFKNSARPDIVLVQSGDGVLGESEQRRIEEAWNEKHRGSANTRKATLLSGGLDIKEMTRTQVDMDFVNQRTFSRDEILSLFKVPKAIIGITDDVNRASAEATIYVFALRTIKPLMQKLVNNLNEFLVPKFGEPDLYFTFTSPVMADRIQTIAEYTAGIDKWLTRNEIRAREGLIASDEGDNFFGNPMLMPVDKVPTEKKIHKPSKKSNIEDTVNKFIAKLPNMGKKTMTDDVKKTYIEMWKKGIETSKTAFGKKLIKYFEKQKKEVITNLNSEMKGLNAKEYKLKALSDVLFNESNAIKTGISLVTPFIQDWIKRSGNNASDLTDQNFDDNTDSISKFTKDRAKYFADTINQTTADDLMTTLKEGTTNGETLEELSKRIADVYDIAEGSRADMIARTEVSASSNFGALEAYTQAGVEQIQWVVVNPEDEDCLANDGQIVSIGDEFNSGDEQPPVHPNCVCTTIPIF